MSEVNPNNVGSSLGRQNHQVTSSNACIDNSFGCGSVSRIGLR